jgi:MFS family permease
VSTPSHTRRDFRLLLLGQTTSQLGTQVSSVAVPLLAVLTLHATPVQLGLVNASATLAFLLVGLPAGACLDRLHRRPVLVAADAVRALLLGAIPAAAAFGGLGIGLLIAVSSLVGVARVFFDVGYQSYLPTVVGPGGVLKGNATMETIRTAGQIVGPGLGGWLVGLVGAADVVLVQAVTFAVSALSLAAIRTQEAAPAAPPVRIPVRAQIAEGLAYVARTPVLRATAITSALCNLTFALASAVSVIFMTRDLGMSATGVGLVVAAGSVMAMAGAAGTPWLARRVGSARIVWIALAVTGPLAILGPLAQRGWAVALLVVGTAAGELGQIVYAITNVSLRQRLCPDGVLARVNATMRVLIMGLFPFGALLGGVLGELLGPRAALLATCAVGLPAPIPVYLALRGVRDVDDLTGGDR